MKGCISLHLAGWSLAVLLLPLGAGAAQDLTKELVDLRSARDKAVEQAVRPINERYRTQLQGLLQRATRSGELDSAVAIRKELERATSDTQAIADLGGLPSFEGTSWAWHNRDSSTPLAGVLTLEANGKVKRPSSVGFITGWAPVSGKQFKILSETSAHWVFEFDPARGEARSVFEKGAIQDHKTMVLQSRK